METDHSMMVAGFATQTQRPEALPAHAPLMESLHRTWKRPRDEGQVQSSFYLNYTTDEIDFEAVPSSSCNLFAVLDAFLLTVEAAQSGLRVPWQLFREVTDVLGLSRVDTTPCSQ